MEKVGDGEGGGWGRWCSSSCTWEVFPPTPPHRPQQGGEEDLYDLHEVIWLRSAAPDPGLKNSLREAKVLGEQQGIPSQKPAKVRQ